MQAFKKMRLFHWLLAILFIAAYLTGDDAGLAHIWLGYGLIVLLAIRLLLAWKKTRGFPSLLPGKNVLRFSRVTAAGSLLTLTLLLTLAGTLWLGTIMVDNGKALTEGVQRVLPVEVAFASSSGAEIGGKDAGSAHSAGYIASRIEDPEEIHEWLANLALALVGAHIGWIILFRRRQAWAMLFGPRASAGPAGSDRSAHSSGPGSPSESHLPHSSHSSFPPRTDSDPDMQTLRVRRIVRENGDACSIELENARDASALPNYLPGQYLMVQIPRGGDFIQRCYSLSSSPGVDPFLRITARRVRGGIASNWLNDGLQPGDLLKTGSAAGQFTPASLDTGFLLYASGSGITPILSILRSVLFLGRGHVRLFYANPDNRQAIFIDDLLRLQQLFPERFEMHLHEDATDGLPTLEALVSTGKSEAITECFICGHPQFMRLAEQAAHVLKIEASRIHAERFSDMTDPDGIPGLSERFDGTAVATLTVSLAGKTHVIDSRHGETLLDAMDRQGLKTPSACRSGVCGSCKCRVDKGRTSRVEAVALTANEADQGLTLSCQAHAVSSEVAIHFD